MTYPTSTNGRNAKRLPKSGSFAIYFEAAAKIMPVMQAIITAVTVVAKPKKKVSAHIILISPPPMVFLLETIIIMKITAITAKETRLAARFCGRTSAAAIISRGNISSDRCRIISFVLHR